MGCPFCELDAAALAWSSDDTVALRDRFPVSPGHTLVIPRRHVESYWDASESEQRGIWRAVAAVKAQLDAERRPDGYNVGFNAGVTAGQTVMHAHVHVIPRYRGDVEDPRGGVRGVIPGMQKHSTAEGAGHGAGASEPIDPFDDLVDFVPGEESHLVDSLRRALRRSERADIVSAFVQPSGLELIEPDLVDAVARGAAVRVLTGDYLGVTHPHALQQLYALSTKHPRLEARLHQAGARAFHAKAYVFQSGRHGVAFIGSSNLSRSALTDGVEWNLRATSSRNGPAFARIVARFDALWNAPASKVLTAEVVATYQSTVRVPPAPEPAAVKPEPHGIQLGVLAQLEQARRDGCTRGLVVMATGLGKTYLAAFDFARTGGQRLLFIAHREEILEQAERTFARVFPDRTRGLMVGGRRDRDVDLLFASVQTISRPEHLLALPKEHFDAIVVDEFHHAAASTYRRILGHFNARFVLGLTATPDRLDGASLFDLCDDNLVARVGLVEGISRGILVPFRYYGVKDSVDFEPIPWRSGRFDEDALTAAVSTAERAEEALRVYRQRATDRQQRTLVFCCSVRHANFMRDFLRDKGLQARAVHSGEGSDGRAESLRALRAGEIEFICAVDVFNEGLDVPDVTTVLMLRPTESPVIFLQQLGRGLRRATTVQKDHLVVVDFIGNHRSFLRKPQALLALTGQDVPPGQVLGLIRDKKLDLPPGCSVEIETEALDMLEKLSRLSADDRLLFEYASLRDGYGHRPTASEVFARGVVMKPVKDRHGSWHDFVAAQGDLTADETRVLDAHRDWFRDLLTTPMSRSYKMVAINVLLDASLLTQGMDVRAMALRARDMLKQDVLLRIELKEHEAKGGDLEQFVSDWRKHPLRIFHDAEGFSRAWFRVVGDRFESALKIAEGDVETFNAMTEEIVDLRLREFKARHRYTSEVLPLAAPIVLRVSHANGNPILRFDRTRRSDIPDGDVQVMVDEEPLWLRFQKIAANVALERLGGPNVLPSRMRRWFGTGAGLPGTRHEVLLERADSGWRLRALPEDRVQSAELIPFPKVPFFPSLRVACGPGAPLGENADEQGVLAVEASVKLDPKRHFVVRAEGDSMNGGDAPIADEDLVLCAWSDVSRAEEVEGKVSLLSGVGGPEQAFAVIKVPVRVKGQWMLRSGNPAFADQAVDEGTTLRVVARVVGPVQPATGLVLWGAYKSDAIARQFGSTYGRHWQVGHYDVELNGSPHTVLLVTLDKAKQSEAKYRYADRFNSPTELEWESQDSTIPEASKGRSIIRHKEDGRVVHLFARFHSKTAEQKGEVFTYCGDVVYQRHQGSKPMRVWWRLRSALPRELWRAWVE